MNRQIKFRGKRVDTGGWIFGYYLEFSLCDGEGRCSYIKTDGCQPIKVLPDTVGQFTGLLDKNGKEIYEGDILSVCNGSINCFPWMTKPYSVEYRINKGFTMPMFLWDKEGCDCSDNTHWCEVIGNIYDNPELLKGGKE